ncbi:glycosyl hydrolase [Gordonia sp. PKS22-38]|uniref:Glycosyl hydrolase n=1 Tax=Gordonia prachuapensis TaxID=3115651 RepID=A0ABU7MZL3_9ACTN|nr:glycosyl hydrolase [Gordonia sp. PKS22-38]
MTTPPIETESARDEVDGGFADRWSKRRRRHPSILIPVIAMVIGVGAAGALFQHYLPPPEPPCAVVDSTRVVPDEGVLFGVNLDWEAESLGQHRSMLGHAPAVAVQFSDIPYDNATWAHTVAAAEQVKTDSGVMVLTLEPHAGLAAIDEGVIGRLGDDLRKLNDSGVPVILRFAHEMNGTWYAWGQQPVAYVETFRRVAAMIDRKAPGTAMMWAPNYGGGYPFVGGKYAAAPDTADFDLVDTDHDGELTADDDSYGPYYPGDDVVDWAGISLYHWGNKRPWGDNEITEPGKFSRMLEGTYLGTAGDDRAVPNFYQEYGVDRGQPVAIVETAAIYTPSRADEGAAELAVKSMWWKQVFAADIPDRFPELKMINWFEWKKYEIEIDDTVDWRAAGSPVVHDEFVHSLPDWFRYAEAVDAC